MCTLLFVLLSILSIYIGRRRKYVAVGWLLYVGTLVPVIGLVQAGAQAMADRYMYIPMVGLLIIAAWAVKDLIANRPRLRIVAAVLAIAVLSSAVILTRMQVRHWQNSITLFDYALKVTKNNWIAENSYGCALSKVGWLDEAVLHLRKAVLINPGFFDARINLGKVLLMQGNLSEAVARFNELLERKQSSAEVYYHLAVALSRQKKYDEAIKCFARAIELDPKYPYARSGMGIILAATGRPDEAIVCFNDALRVTPDPDKADVYANLGLAYNQLGKYEQALRNWTRAAELNPNSTEVLNNLAWLLATAGDVSAQDANRAIELAERACELTGHKEPGSLDTLAAAYAAGDRFDDAVTMARQAIDAAKARGQEGAAREIQKRIELYKAGQRYIQK
jgi:tetratricopeptide (TPR) repeat protein